MRVAVRTRPAALFGALMLVALVVLLPLRLVLGWAGIGDEGLSARRVEGSVWSGRLVEARIGDASLGDLAAHVSPLALVAGKARLALDSIVDVPQRTVHGSVETGRHAIGIAGMTANVGVGRLFAPLPVATLDLDDVTVRFADEACQTAQGRVRATLAGATGAFGGVALPASLAGGVRCDGPALLVPLTSAGGGRGGGAAGDRGRAVPRRLHPPATRSGDRGAVAGGGVRRGGGGLAAVGAGAVVIVDKAVPPTTKP